MYKKEMEILKTAIINEQEGYQFYMLAADKADNDDLRDVFLKLAGDERDHEDWLRRVYKGILEKGRPDPVSFEEPSRSPEIFSLSKLKNSGGLIVSALHIGIMMEKESMDFYRLAALEAETPELKHLLKALEKWESRHLEQLEQAYDFARDDWWEQQGFSPA